MQFQSNGTVSNPVKYARNKALTMTTNGVPCFSPLAMWISALGRLHPCVKMCMLIRPDMLPKMNLSVACCAHLCVVVRLEVLTPE